MEPLEQHGPTLSKERIQVIIFPFFSFYETVLKVIVLSYIACLILKTTKLILLDSLLQEVEATLPHLVFQKDKE
jgi:hypothetical protein